MQHKPEIEQEETFIHSRDGDEVEITCTIHASPPAEVEWYRNGQLLDPRQVVISRRGNRHTLMLHNIGQLSLDHLENMKNFVLQLRIQKLMKMLKVRMV